MHQTLKHLSLGLTVLAGLAASPMLAAAEDAYPSKPITIIVPLAPGGGTDLAARLMAQHLTQSLGQQVVVENHPGAAGTIGVQAGRAADPDGYTLVVIGASYSVNPALYNLDFDPVEDITPVVMFSQGGQLLVANAKLGFKTVPDLLAAAKKDPGKITSASVGAGSVSDLATALLGTMGGAQFTSVQYKGIGPALTDTVAGVTDISFASPGAAFPQVEAGMLTALATTSKVPIPGHPEVPTVAQSGMPDYDVSLWYGIIGPKGLPAPIVDKINAAVNDMLKDPEVVKKINTDGYTPVGGSPADFKARIAKEVAQWKEVAKGMNLKAQ
jgi:tripartite-type tricarboxylate transporter receptor subunit TctC